MPVERYSVIATITTQNRSFTVIRVVTTRSVLCMYPGVKQFTISYSL